jgi:hypothetical protein
VNMVLNLLVLDKTALLNSNRETWVINYKAQDTVTC